MSAVLCAPPSSSSPSTVHDYDAQCSRPPRPDCAPMAASPLPLPFPYLPPLPTTRIGGGWEWEPDRFARRMLARTHGRFRRTSRATCTTPSRGAAHRTHPAPCCVRPTAANIDLYTRPFDAHFISWLTRTDLRDPWNACCVHGRERVCVPCRPALTLAKPTCSGPRQHSAGRCIALACMIGHTHMHAWRWRKSAHGHGPLSAPLVLPLVLVLASTDCGSRGGRCVRPIPIRRRPRISQLGTPALRCSLLLFAVRGATATAAPRQLDKTGSHKHGHAPIQRQRQPAVRGVLEHIVCLMCRARLAPSATHALLHLRGCTSSWASRLHGRASSLASNSARWRWLRVGTAAAAAASSSARAKEHESSSCQWAAVRQLEC